MFRRKTVNKIILSKPSLIYYSLFKFKFKQRKKVKDFTKIINLYEEKHNNIVKFGLSIRFGKTGEISFGERLKDTKERNWLIKQLESGINHFKNKS
ncbi:hypothetical protein [Urechidicola croceus]|uniref:Uncharacterized protein n=1 Tax=Urechidicola croceus TaxID=1850246 RepID=A0A1D8P7P4_9FLAO|nr:hypothetical protein [Urechidicola croceus]AOW20583.1 hypothetical protein LPB138_07780 [Urechidicola croceus]